MDDAYDKIQTIYDRICNYREDATYNKDELIAELVSVYTIISDENDNGQRQLLDFIEKQIDIVFLFPSSTVWTINDVGNIVNNIMTLYRMGDVDLKGGLKKNESQNTDTGSAKESNGYGDSETTG